MVPTHLARRTNLLAGMALGRRSKSSISALAYKALQRNTQKPPLPTIKSPSWSTDAAISSILYETPAPKKNRRKPHVLQCLVQNEPGVLARVSSALAGRGFNIESLVVSNTEVRDLSRMTIVLYGQPGVVEQARCQVEDLVPVWAVLDYSDAPLVERELVLAKISLLGPEYFAQLVSHHAIAQKTRLGEAIPKLDPADQIKDYHPSKVPVSEALRHKHEHLTAITNLAGYYGGKVSHISDRNCIVELCATPDSVTRFLHHVKPFGLIEVTRTGRTVLPQTPLDDPEVEELDFETESEAVELGDLPPG